MQKPLTRANDLIIAIKNNSNNENKSKADF